MWKGNALSGSDLKDSCYSCMYTNFSNLLEKRSQAYDFVHTG